MSGCHIWSRSIAKMGYGQLFANGGPVLAHRFAWEKTRGEIPVGMHVLHKCDNRACVNVDHLFLGTNADNIADRVRKHRSWHGHRSGEGANASKLRWVQVLEIREIYSLGQKSQRELARMYGITQPCVGSIVRRESWVASPTDENSLPRKAPLPIVRRTLAATFEDHIVKDADSGCWIWTAGKVGGYGTLRHRGKKITAHRFAYQMANGPIGQGLVLRHECDRTDCCNPDHLIVGTQAENVRDMVARGRLVPPPNRWLARLSP